MFCVHKRCFSICEKVKVKTSGTVSAVGAKSTSVAILRTEACFERMYNRHALILDDGEEFWDQRTAGVHETGVFEYWLF